MKNVIIVTLFGEHNMGNRLQNYALQKKIESYGCRVTTLNDCMIPKISLTIFIKRCIKRVLALLGSSKYSQEIKNLKLLKRNLKPIRVFNENNISMVKSITHQQAFETDWSNYDLAIAGSDQIWHKWYNDDVKELPYYYLQFIPKEKRVAYAASFGFESFPEKDIEQHLIGLQGMREISCREESGCKLVKELTGRCVPRVLDPTLLLSVDEWREVETQSNNIAKKHGKYAFSMFLGNIPDNYREYINYTMKKRGIDKLIDFNGKEIGACGPSEFLNWIDNAQFVFTDSFHCTVFSIIFEKEFTVFRRVQHGFENMFGRIEDLLASTNKLDHIYGEIKNHPTNNFDELYNNSIQYLERILEIKNEN